MHCCRCFICAASPPAFGHSFGPVAVLPSLQEALSAILGADAPNLTPGVISRLTAGWQEEYDRWQTRDLSARRYVCIWADGVYLQARMEPEAECILVIIGATPEGRKELLGLPCRGPRERAELAGITD